MDTGLTNYQIDLGQGPAPLYYIFALSDLNRLSGEDGTCMTRFEQRDLKKFDLLKDHDNVTGFPLAGNGLAAGEFYDHFLYATNRLSFILNHYKIKILLQTK